MVPIRCSTANTRTKGEQNSIMDRYTLILVFFSMEISQHFFPRRYGPAPQLIHMAEQALCLAGYLEVCGWQTQSVGPNSSNGHAYPK